jgi:(E)-4-hydroxy-3-methylbut-2-enyl-diphosphate synthase
VGIGTLLEDGLGDTIRVSLTEEPEFEIPVAKELVKRYETRSGHDSINDIYKNPLYPYEYRKRESRQVMNIGGDNVSRVMVDLSLENEITRDTLNHLGYSYFEADDKWGIGDFACDYIFVNKKSVDFDIPGTLGIVQAYSVWIEEKKTNIYPFLDAKQYLDNPHLHPKLNFIYATLPELSADLLSQFKNDISAVLLIDTYNEHGMAEQRRLFMELMSENCQIPVIIGKAYGGLTPENLQLYSATDMGALLIDGLGDGVFLAAEGCGSLEQVNQTAFGILQASRTRISKTEYISCPSCGRTLFDLQETTALVRNRTSHLKGIKIGIMGCIVNGPGEMADADYGYVGTGVEKISLYRGQNVVQANLPMEEAVDALIDLMKEDGVWVEAQELDAVY